MRNLAFWALALEGTGYKGLFGVVTDKSCKDRMASPLDAIATLHFNSSFAI
jgi:hypothetical protein